MATQVGLESQVSESSPQLCTWHTYIPKYLGKSVHDQIKPIQTQLNNLLKKTPNPNPPWALKTFTVDLELTNQINKQTQSASAMKQIALAYITKYEPYTKYYTDGSKEQEITACAFVTNNHVVKCRLPDHGNILAAELKAIQLAVAHIKETPNIEHAVLFSDSLLALHNLTNETTNEHSPLLDIISRDCATLNLRQTKITMVWIPSHVGIHGNELADQSAKDARALPQRELDHTAPTIYTNKNCYDKARNWLVSEWQTYYNTKTQAHHYKNIEPVVSTAIKGSHNSRQQEVIITRLRLGHCLTMKTLFRYKWAPSANCIHCNTTEDVEHLITCPLTNYTQGCASTKSLPILKNQKDIAIVAKNILKAKRRI